MLNLLTIMVQLLSKSLLRVAIDAEIKVSSFLLLFIFNVLFFNEQEFGCTSLITGIRTLNLVKDQTKKVTSLIYLCVLFLYKAKNL